MRYLPALFPLLLSVASLGYDDPFLPGLELGSGPATVAATLTESGLDYERDTIVQSTGHEILYLTVNHLDLQLDFKFNNDDEMLRIDGSSKRGLDEGRLRGIIADWWELLTVIYGQPDESVTADEAEHFSRINAVWNVATWGRGSWTVRLFGNGYTSAAGEGLLVSLEIEPQGR